MTRDVQHYDKNYYSWRYGRVMADGDYLAALGCFWRWNLFDSTGEVPPQPILDYGCGPGHVSAAIGADCYDPSEYIQGFLRQRGRNVFSTLDSIPRCRFSSVLCSHSLEHALHPMEELLIMSAVLKPGGRLYLILPCEKMPGLQATDNDVDRHYYSWSFQNVANLIREAGFRTLSQREVFGPTGLGTLWRRMGPSCIPLCARLGKWRKNYRSTFTTAVLMD